MNFHQRTTQAINTLLVRHSHVFICIAMFNIICSYINANNNIIFCNVKTVVCGPYLGVCMHLLREGELWVVLACHHHLCSTQGFFV